MKTLSAPEVQVPMSLSEATTACSVRVTSVSGHCDDVARLQSMGVCVGRRIMLLRAGDPLVVQVAGTRIGISGRLAKQVKVIALRESDETKSAA